jgi:ABC-type phosphate/phosphonate transport system permease subunit
MEEIWTSIGDLPEGLTMAAMLMTVIHAMAISALGTLRLFPTDWCDVRFLRVQVYRILVFLDVAPILVLALLSIPYVSRAVANDFFALDASHSEP